MRVSTEQKKDVLIEMLGNALNSCWEQLSLWTADIPEDELSPEDGETLTRAAVALEFYQYYTQNKTAINEEK